MPDDTARPSDPTPHQVLNPHALTAWREERGMRKTDLATEADVGLGYLCDLEKGRRPGTAPVIRRLADALRVNVRVLVQNPNDVDDDARGKGDGDAREQMEENLTGRRRAELVDHLPVVGSAAEGQVR